ncbi:MAG: hypothetical protein LJE83_04365 [Gammaproteobacteria bacterium]|nr:hypothetical protein [Gammaproteobacteria bacterium]
MRIALAIFIYFVTVCQPANAVIDDSIIDIAVDEDISPVPYGNGSEQPGKDEAGSAVKVLPEASRGQMLYENHCTGCHESMVYIRAKRKAKNFKQVSYWVSQRADWLNLNWTELEKQDVLQYLNERFYKYPLTE